MTVTAGRANSDQELGAAGKTTGGRVVRSPDLDHEHLTAADILRAVAFALPAIEIVDSRFAHGKIGILDSIADTASSGLYAPRASLKKLPKRLQRRLRLERRVNVFRDFVISLR